MSKYNRISDRIWSSSWGVLAPTRVLQLEVPVGLLLQKHLADRALGALSCAPVWLVSQRIGRQVANVERRVVRDKVIERHPTHTKGALEAGRRQVNANLKSILWLNRSLRQLRRKWLGEPAPELAVVIEAELCGSLLFLGNGLPFGRVVAPGAVPLGLLIASAAPRVPQTDHLDLAFRRFKLDVETESSIPSFKDRKSHTHYISISNVE